MKNTLLTFGLMLCTVALLAQVSAKEKQALLDLFVATNGENWTHSWDTNTPVSDWQGIIVENNKVVSISLLFNNMEGTIPASLGDLEALTVLEMSFNKLSGKLPASLGNLSNLEILAFNGNNLKGSIPESFENLKNLKQLHLSSNKLSGTIPNTLGDLDNLEVFNVFDNNLVGDIPSGLANHRSLRELMVAENNLVSTANFSAVLLSNSGAKIDVNKPVLTPGAKTVIATETSDDEN
ncbi:leucine rich repeat (LRR) protein [Ulvibacter sp. MAR_2010_11]|uniref:leucine-rich repeat domain-containing protein n=1 Tax=Ulvibacter sp. MAR_2010_11 TaxID=1250229 RepID=UPI000C2C3F6A|nr:leucine-rich repeat domain-containing protein [Ulvibacter sp. MAR_2010_11]PKA84401.1 leucine rich repeat (LRR) protein [Ulvibacter sp. MAR_2010_11]